MSNSFCIVNFSAFTLNLPHLLSFFPGAQYVKDSVGVISEHNITTVIQLNKDVVLSLLRAKSEVQHSVHTQLLHLL